MQSAKKYDGIVSDAKEILNELISCKENGNLIAVWGPTLGRGLSIYSVENIRKGHTENDIVIILKEKDLRGSTIQTRVVYLREIEKVHAFKKIKHDIDHKKS